MRFLWSRHSIRWFLEASAYSDFHRNLAERIKPYLRPDDTLCDAGCGLGRLDLELAPYVSSLTAIDTDSNVISELQKDAAQLGLKNLQALCGDAAALTGCFDLVLMSFFGKTGMSAYYPLCRRKLIRIVNAVNQSKLYPNQQRHTQKDTISSVKQELTAKGSGFDLVVDKFEFGQPLRSWQEGELFISHHAPKASPQEISNFLHDNAVSTGRDDFPYYLPNHKEIGIFIIDASYSWEKSSVAK